MKKLLFVASLSHVLLLGAAVSAQPFDPNLETEPAPGPPRASQPQHPESAPEPPGDFEGEDYAEIDSKALEMESDQPNAQYAPKDENAMSAFPRMRTPQLISSPTGHLLPAAVVQSTVSLDTGGSFGGSTKIGLGDVGEFGVETTPLIRLRSRVNSSPETVQPLVLASFRMGVAEDRLFANQPALALGFRKSFSRKASNSEIRVAGIDLVASKTFGKTSIHVGSVFWDAQMRDVETGEVVLLHDGGARRQIRPFGGIEAEPIKNAQLLIDLYWVPQFSAAAGTATDAIKLKPTLSWGVRYKLVPTVSFESGVRVPDIGDANLLDAQIFGQLTMSTDKIRRALGVSE